MSFSAKRVRVEVPWQNAAELPGAGDVAAAEPIFDGSCVDGFSRVYASCLDEFTWYLIMHAADEAASPDPDGLAALRSSLEARLARVHDAEQKLPKP